MGCLFYISVVFCFCLFAIPRGIISENRLFFTRWQMNFTPQKGFLDLDLVRTEKWYSFTHESYNTGHLNETVQVHRWFNSYTVKRQSNECISEQYFNMAKGGGKERSNPNNFISYIEMNEGKEVSSSHCYFHEDHTIKSITTYTSNNTQLLSISIAYDNRGRPVQQILDGDTVSSMFYQYDKSGNLVETKICDDDNLLLTYTTYFYESDNIRLAKEYRADGTLVGSTVVRYNDDGCVLQIESFDEAGMLISHTSFEYDFLIAIRS